MTQATGSRDACPATVTVLIPKQTVCQGNRGCVCAGEIRRRRRLPWRWWSWGRASDWLGVHGLAKILATPQLCLQRRGSACRSSHPAVVVISRGA